MEDLLLQLTGVLNTPLSFFCLPVRFVVVDGHLAVHVHRRPMHCWVPLDPIGWCARWRADGRNARAERHWQARRHA